MIYQSFILELWSKSTNSFQNNWFKESKVMVETNLRETINVFINQCLPLITWNQKHCRKLYQQHTNWRKNIYSYYSRTLLRVVTVNTTECTPSPLAKGLEKNMALVLDFKSWGGSLTISEGWILRGAGGAWRPQILRATMFFCKRVISVATLL